MRHFFWLHLHRELHGSPSSLLSPLIRSKRRILTIIFCLGKRDILVWWIEDMSVWIILYSIVALLMHKTVGYIWSVSIIFRSISRNMKQSSLNFFSTGSRSLSSVQICIILSLQLVTILSKHSTQCVRSWGTTFEFGSPTTFCIPPFICLVKSVFGTALFLWDKRTISSEIIQSNTLIQTDSSKIIFIVVISDEECFRQLSCNE